MSTLFGTLLSLHVILGLVGVIASFWTTFLLLRNELSRCTLTAVSLVAFVSYILSWFTGGWYYWKHYGTVVKPVIMSGKYPWAHSIFTEAKEHTFLFLPFVALMLTVLLWFGFDSVSSDQNLKRKTMFLSLTITIVGTIVALSGVLITGGAR